MKGLQHYEFMDAEAQHKFQELIEMLRKAMTDSFFRDVHKQICDMSPEQMERLKEMMKDLNQMLSEKMAGDEPDFDQFMASTATSSAPTRPRTSKS